MSRGRTVQPDRSEDAARRQPDETGVSLPPPKLRSPATVRPAGYGEDGPCLPMARRPAGTRPVPQRANRRPNGGPLKRCAKPRDRGRHLCLPRPYCPQGAMIRSPLEVR